MTTKPLWINEDEGAPEYAAVDLRRNLAMLLTPGVADGLGARAGVRPGGSAAVTLSGQTISVHPRPVTVYPGESSTDGPYVGHLMGDTHTLDPADGSNPRRDIVIVRVYDDDHDASGERHLVTEYLPGSPSSSPDPEPTPPGATLLAEVLVPAGGDPAPSLTYLAPYTVAAGGVLPVRGDAEGPSTGLYHGMVRYRQDIDVMEVWDGSQWQRLAVAAGGWETIVATTISGATTIPIESGVFDMIRVYLRGTVTSLGYIGLRVNNDATEALHRSGITVFNPSTGDVAANFSENEEMWRLAQWESTAVNQVAHATIYNTAASGNLSFEGGGYRTASATGSRRQSISGGGLSGNRLLSSLAVLSSAGAPGTTRVVVEGLRL